jgi:3-dehydroquinate synthase
VKKSNSNHTIEVQLKERSYPIIVSATLPKLIDLNLQSQVYIITDEKVAELYLELFIETADNIQGCYSIPVGEKSKSLTQAEDIFTSMIEAGCDRGTTIIALGGGVVGDLAGFVAATFMRGVPFYQCPTTLLAMVDSSVGGKVAVNHKLGKNVIGNFYQPKGVFISTEALKTLPQNEFAAGMAEVIKYGIITDENFFSYLENNIEALHNLDTEALFHIILKSVQIKADIVSKDECEKNGLRALLNLGHTFAHAEETLSGYGKILHGEAVAAGMVAASKVSVSLNKMNENDESRVVKLIKKCRLPIDLSQLKDFNAFWQCMEGDKKNQNGQVHFIIPDAIGECPPPFAIERSNIEKALF